MKLQSRTNADVSCPKITQVPHSVPVSKALKSIHLKKAEEYVIQSRGPLPFGPPPVVVGQKDGPAIRPSKPGILLWWKEFQGNQKGSERDY